MLFAWIWNYYSHPFGKINLFAFLSLAFRFISFIRFAPFQPVIELVQNIAYEKHEETISWINFHGGYILFYLFIFSWICFFVLLFTNFGVYISLLFIRSRISSHCLHTFALLRLVFLSARSENFFIWCAHFHCLLLYDRVWLLYLIRFVTIYASVCYADSFWPLNITQYLMCVL